VEASISDTIEKAGKLSETIIQEGVEGLTSFLNDMVGTPVESFKKFSHHSRSEENGESGVNVDVMVEVYPDTQQEKSSKAHEEENASNHRETDLMQCFNTLTNSPLEIDAKGEVLSISCTEEQCRKCLLWFYLTSQKNSGKQVAA